MGGLSTMKVARAALVLALSLAGVNASGVPRLVTAVRANPAVAFTVQPEAGSWRWRFTLRNQGDAPVVAVADRRLVSVEFPVTVPGPRRRGGAAPRCVHGARPIGNEFAPRVTLAPGASYSEVFDLRDTCGLRVPAVSAGAPLSLRYGFAETRPPSLARSVLIDEGPDAVPALVTTVVAPELPSAPTDAPGEGLLRLQLRGSQAPRHDGLRVTVRLENPSVQPVWTLYRHGLFAFEVERPDGRAATCRGLTREPAPQRDFFARLGGRGVRAATLLPSPWCPTNTFEAEGIYTVRAIFESRADGAQHNLQRVFTGRISSGPAVLRVMRGDGRYRPWEPQRSP